MKRMTAALVMALLCGMSYAAEVRVLSAGAVEPGLHAFAKLAKQETGHDLRIQFNTAPQIAKRLAAGEVYGILISPPAAITGAAKEGKVLAETRAPVGRVGAGIIVRSAAAAPNVSSVDALKQALGTRAAEPGTPGAPGAPGRTAAAGRSAVRRWAS